MDKKMLGMPANVALGLSYLFWPLAVIILLADKELTREDKVDLVASIILGVVCVVLSAICIGTLLWIYALVIAIFRFTGKDTKVVLASDLAEKMVK